MLQALVARPQKIYYMYWYCTSREHCRLHSQSVTSAASSKRPGSLDFVREVTQQPVEACEGACNKNMPALGPRRLIVELMEFRVLCCHIPHWANNCNRTRFLFHVAVTPSVPV